MARFMRKGITKFYFCPTITNKSAPTVAQLTAGERLDEELAEVNGLSFDNNPIEVPDMSSAFVAQIGGEDKVADTTLTFYEDDTDNPIRTALPKGTLGYVVVFPAGTAGATPAAADVCDVWPAQVTSNSKQYTAGNEAAKYAVKFAMTEAPAEEAVVAS